MANVPDPPGYEPPPAREALLPFDRLIPALQAALAGDEPRALVRSVGLAAARARGEGAYSDEQWARAVVVLERARRAAGPGSPRLCPDCGGKRAPEAAHLCDEARGLMGSL